MADKSVSPESLKEAPPKRVSDILSKDEIPPVPSASEAQPQPAVPAPRRRRRREKAKSLPVYEQFNWLIHHLYTRREYSHCELLVDGSIKQSHGTSEYAFFIKGLIEREKGNIEAALRAFQRASAINPANIYSIKQVARTSILLSRYKAALEEYQKASRLCSTTDWSILHNQAICYMHLGDVSRAKDLFRQALTIQKRDVTYLQLAKALVLEASIPEAIAVLEEAKNFSPENTEILRSLGLVHLKTGNTAHAFEHLGNALAFDPTDSQTILGACSIIQDCGDYDVALVKYRVSAVRTPESPELWNNIGMCFFGKGKIIAAISCLKRAIYMAPFEWRINYNLGLCHMQQKQYASAFQFLSAAVNLNPGHAQGFMLLGSALMYLEDEANAVGAFERALDLDRDDPLIPLNFAILLYTMDENRGAAEQITEFSKRRKSQDVDKDLASMADRLAAALQVGTRHRKTSV